MLRCGWLSWFVPSRNIIVVMVRAFTKHPLSRHGSCLHETSLRHPSKTESQQHPYSTTSPVRMA